MHYHLIGICGTAMASLAGMLQARGHRVVIGRNATSANSIAVTADGYAGVADPRTRGALAAGY